MVDTLPNLILLEIFDLYLFEQMGERWHTMVHVCQKWRNVVFGSPHRLDLRLICTARTPVRKTLDVWPLLPIVVLGFDLKEWGVDKHHCGTRAH